MQKNKKEVLSVLKADWERGEGKHKMHIYLTRDVSRGKARYLIELDQHEWMIGDWLDEMEAMIDKPKPVEVLKPAKSGTPS